MTEFFNRAFRVEVGDREFSNANALRFTFSVERDGKLTPNACTVSLYNLAETTRHDLEAQTFIPVRVQVGYETGGGQIFLGGLRTAESTRNGADWITEVRGGDGEKEILQARVAKTFAKGASYKVVLTALVDALGVKRGNLGSLEAPALLSSGATSLAKALTVRGGVAEELEALTRSLGLEWSIQDGAFQVAASGQPAQTQSVVLSADSGLIGVPSVDKDGLVSGTALLIPDLLPGRTFRVESERVTGNLVCTKTVHSGDSESTEWYVHFTGKPY